jgi:hypothetical protein
MLGFFLGQKVIMYSTNHEGEEEPNKISPKNFTFAHP